MCSLERQDVVHLTLQCEFVTQIHVNLHLNLYIHHKDLSLSLSLYVMTKAKFDE